MARKERFTLYVKAVIFLVGMFAGAEARAQDRPAEVIFYRFKDGIYNPPISVDGVRVGKSYENHYFVVLVPVGQHTFRTATKPFQWVCECQSGERYYARVEYIGAGHQHMMRWSAKAYRIVPVPQDVAVGEIEGLTEKHE